MRSCSLQYLTTIKLSSNIVNHNEDCVCYYSFDNSSQFDSAVRFIRWWVDETETFPLYSNIFTLGVWTKWNKEKENSKCLGGKSRINCLAHVFYRNGTIRRIKVVPGICRHGEFHQNLYKVLDGCFDNETSLFDHKSKITMTTEEIVTKLNNKGLWETGRQQWTKCTLASAKYHNKKAEFIHKKYRGEIGGESYIGFQDMIYLCPRDKVTVWRTVRRHCCAGRLVPFGDHGHCSRTCGQGTRKVTYVCAPNEDSDIIGSGIGREMVSCRYFYQNSSDVTSRF